MKRAILFILTSAFLCSIFCQSLIFAHYFFNRTYYATVLCENKSKKEMHCNGHCRLAKELKQQEKSAEIPFTSFKEKNEIVQYFELEEPFSFSEFFTDQIFVVFKPFLEPEGYFQTIFHPPAV